MKSIVVPHKFRSLSLSEPMSFRQRQVTTTELKVSTEAQRHRTSALQRGDVFRTSALLRWSVCWCTDRRLAQTGHHTAVRCESKQHALLRYSIRTGAPVMVSSPVYL